MPPGALGMPAAHSGEETMNLNTIAPAMRDNPYPYYAMARQMAPVVWNDAAGMWNAFGYEDCNTILRDHERFSSEHRKFNPELQRGRPSMLTMDPPRHTQLRNLINRAFTPRRVAGLEPRIQEITDGLLAEVLPSGRMDIVEHLAVPLPVIIIAELLGVPPADRARFKHWSDVIVANLGQDFTGAGPPEVQSVQDEFIAYFTEQLDDHRRAPKDDLIGALLAADIDGERLAAEELLTFCILLLVAGNETTTNLIGNAVRLLLEYPEQQARLRADLTLVPSAIEESLRFRPPVQATIRSVAQDLELRGQQLKRGQRVAVWLAAANRDPAEFPDPETFDIGRTPNRHLSFGQGIHFCLGAPLARLETKVALAALLERVPAMARADQSPLIPVEGFIMHGIRSLPVVLDPVQAAAAV